MKVLVDGIGEVILTDNDFFDYGGEGNIYIKNNVVYKIYHEAKKMIPIEKIKELNSLDMDNIIKPEQVIYSVNREPLGYTMKPVVDFYPLSRIMTNDFRQQHNIDNDKILNIIVKMKKTIQHIHEKGCLFVDGNEMNFLISDDFNDVYFIDVDSYKTKKNKATAYTEVTLDPNINIKDQTTFTEDTDWFSFAVLACKIFTGIHPYKGKFKDKSKMKIKDRMQSNISIFNNKISLPKTARDLNLIPDNFKKWFIDIFENGKRLPPPTNIEAVYYKRASSRLVLDSLKFIELKKFSANIEQVTSLDDHLYIKTKKTIEDVNNIYKPKNNQNTYPLYSFYNGDLLLKIENNKLSLFKISSNERIDSDIEVESVFVQDNLIIGKYKNKLFEIVLFEKNDSIKLLVKSVTNVYEKSLKRLNNVYINKLYEKNIIIIPIGNSVFFKETFSELNGCRIVNAKYQNHILSITYFNKSKELFTTYYRLNKNLNSKEIIYQEKDMEIDFAVTEKGVCIINKKDELHITSNKYKTDNNKTIEDKNLSSVRLYSNKTGVFAISNNVLYTISMN